MLRRDTAPSVANLCICRALASRPRLSSRRAVFGDVVPDECAGSTTDISACVTGPCCGCRNRETDGHCDDNRTSQSQGTRRLATRLDNFIHVKNSLTKGYWVCMETAAAMRRPPNPVSESSSGRTYADSILGSIVLMAIAELCNVDEPSGAHTVRDP